MQAGPLAAAAALQAGSRRTRIDGKNGWVVNGKGEGRVLPEPTRTLGVEVDRSGERDWLEGAGRALFVDPRKARG